MADEQAPRDGGLANSQVGEVATGPDESRLEKTSSTESRNAASEEHSKVTDEERMADTGGTALEKVSTGGSKRKGLEERSKGKIVLIMAALSMATFLAALDAVRLPKSMRPRFILITVRPSSLPRSPLLHPSCRSLRRSTHGLEVRTRSPARHPRRLGARSRTSSAASPFY